MEALSQASQEAKDLAIQVEKLCFSYKSGDQRQEIFKDFNWELQTGDFWVVIGKNGSGKSTLIRLLLGLEKPSSGSIRIFGEEISKSQAQPWRLLPNSKRKKILSRAIGYVPQHLHFDPKFPIPVCEVVEGGLLQGFFTERPSKERQQIILRSLEEVGMAAYAKQRFSQLSGGQRQRVLIARALATQAKILILDEPTSSIDPHAVSEITSLCQKLRRKHSIIFITHDLTLIPEVAEHIFCLGQEHRHCHHIQGLDQAQLFRILSHEEGTGHEHGHIIEKL